MSDRTPPADLIEVLIDENYDTESRGFARKAASEILDLVTEWAGGGLIDPATWQRINAEQVDTETIQDDLSGCPYYARWGRLPGHDPEATCYADCHSEPSCITDEPTGGWPLRRDLFTLTPKENL